MNIFEYKNYKYYLRDWLKEARVQKRANLISLAQATRVHASFLSQVILGRKKLSLEQAALASKYLEHTKLEREYFFTLIQLDHAGNPTLKEYWDEKLNTLELEKENLGKRFSRHKQLTIDQQALFYSSWIYSALRVSTDISGSQTLTQIIGRFGISREQAIAILNFLVHTGLCKEKNGNYSIGESHLHISNDSPFVVKHHTNWRIKAIQAMDNREPNELFFTAPMSISTQDFKNFRERLNLFVKDIVENAKTSKAEELSCLNIDFFKFKK